MKLNSKKGFTLIELVVVMGIIALLALLIVGAVIAARRMVTETKHRNNGKSIQVGMEKYYAANKAYPTTTLLTKTDFTFVAGKLGVSLDSTASDGDSTNPNCQSGKTYDGGGDVSNITATTFTISPYNWNCTGALGDTYTQP